MKATIEAQQERLNQIGGLINKTLNIDKSDKGYFVTCNNNPIALTSGRTLNELIAYIDGLRDMYLISNY